MLLGRGEEEEEEEEEEDDDDDYGYYYYYDDDDEEEEGCIREPAAAAYTHRSTVVRPSISPSLLSSLTAVGSSARSPALSRSLGKH